MRQFMILIGLLLPSAAMADDHQEAALKALKALQDREVYALTEYDPSQEGKGLRGKMLQPPQGWQMAVMDLKMVIGGIPRTEYQHVLMPLPADLGDQAHLATLVEVSGITGKDPGPLPREKYEARVTYSKPCEKNPHFNPFLVVELPRPVQTGVEIMAKVFVMVPMANPVGAEAAVRKHGAEKDAVTKYMKAQGLEPFHHWQMGMSNGTKLAGYLAKERKFKSPMEFVDNALGAGKAINMRADLPDQNPSLVLQRNAGDSGGKASVAKRLGGGFLEYVEGYTDQLKKYGGRHAWNLGFADGGMYTADAHEQIHIGEQRPNFIATTLGGWNDLPYVANVNQKAVVSGWVVPVCKQINPIEMTALTFNPANVPDDVAAYFEARKALRTQVYGK